MRIRLLFILTTLAGGGAERSLLNLLRGLDKEKYEIKLFVLRKEVAYSEEIPDDIEVIFGCRKKSIYKSIPSLIKLCRLVYRVDILVGGVEFWAIYLGE